VVSEVVVIELSFGIRDCCAKHHKPQRNWGIRPQAFGLSGTGVHAYDRHVSALLIASIAFAVGTQVAILAERREVAQHVRAATSEWHDVMNFQRGLAR
jgi:hypothetical protein